MQQQYQNQSSEKSTQKNYKLKGRQTKAKGLKFEISKKKLSEFCWKLKTEI